jgi:hypothetical protein
MSFQTKTALLLALALPLAACSHRTNTASRTPDDTLRDGTPEGDHTGSDPSNPRNDVDNNAPPDETSGPEVVPGPGWSGQRQDPPTPPTGGAAGPNGAAPGGSAGPGR